MQDGRSGKKGFPNLNRRDGQGGFMLFGKENFRKKNNGKYLIGYQLLRDTAQISFLRIGEEQPYTLSLVAGKEEYNIPLCLYREEERLWLIGKDAREKGEGSRIGYIDDLLQAAYEGREIQLAAESYNSRALLALFVKKSLSLLSLETSLKQVAAIMFTLEESDFCHREALTEMTEYLQLPWIQMMFMGKEESFFWYNLHTEPGLWSGQVMLYELMKKDLISYRLFINRNTRPMVTMVKKQEYPQWQKEDSSGSKKDDRSFLELCQKDFRNRDITAVYLIGDGFAGDWYQETLRFLCQNRRVFRGNNLYSKGACQGLLQKLALDKLGETYIYLGEEQLSANVGMDLFRQGEASYLAILNGGNSWYDCKKEWDVILQGSNELVFKITPLDGKAIKEYTMTLNGLPTQKEAFSRIRIKAAMSSPRELQIKAKDMGFGQFYASTERIWEDTIEV